MPVQWTSAQVSSDEGERLNCPVTSAPKLKSTLKDEPTKYSGDPTTSACCVRRRAVARMSVCACVYECVSLWVRRVSQCSWHCAKDWGRWVEQVQLGIGGRLQGGAAVYYFDMALLTLLHFSVLFQISSPVPYSWTQWPVLVSALPPILFQSFLFFYSSVCAPFPL